jgi:hypothetical protein
MTSQEQKAEVLYAFKKGDEYAISHQNGVGRYQRESVYCGMIYHVHPSGVAQVFFIDPLLRRGFCLLFATDGNCLENGDLRIKGFWNGEKRISDTETITRLIDFLVKRLKAEVPECFVSKEWVNLWDLVASLVNRSSSYGFARTLDFLGGTRADLVESIENKLREALK